jgi:hypothetical protein
MNHNNELVDYSQAFPGAIIAQGRGFHFITVHKIEDGPQKRADGKRGGYLLEHRELSEKIITPDDQCWACVLSSENQIWTLKELKQIGLSPGKKSQKSDYNIFNNINVF